MSYNFIKKINNEEFSWREDGIKTLEDIHWLFRNLTELGKITDGLEDISDEDFGPGEKLVMDLLVSGVVLTTGFALAYMCLYSKGYLPPTEYFSGISEVMKFI